MCIYEIWPTIALCRVHKAHLYGITRLSTIIVLEIHQTIGRNLFAVIQQALPHLFPPVVHTDTGKGFVKAEGPEANMR